MQTRFYLLMGVSGCGKTTVGKKLAEKLGWDFYDGDDFHPPENIAKMASGIPLTDADRAPWLASLRDLISSCLRTGRPGVLACSALKECYRQVLLRGNSGVQLVYLRGSYDLIWARMAQRPGHYMKPEMLRGQFQVLEEPKNAVIVDVTLPMEEIIDLLGA